MLNALRLVLFALLFLTGQTELRASIPKTRVGSSFSFAGSSRVEILGFEGGPILYAYVRQNPWSSFDPEGLNSLAMGAEELGQFADRIGEPDTAGTIKLVAAAALIVAVSYDKIAETIQAPVPQVEVPPLSQPPGTVALSNGVTITSPGGGTTVGGGFTPTAVPTQMPGTPAGPVEQALTLGGSQEPAKPIVIPGTPSDAPQLPSSTITTPTETAQDITMDKRVNGNSASAARAQHVYEIRDSNGNLIKVGISGQPLNQDGSSPRANRQTSGTTNVPTVVETIPAGTGARKKALAGEQKG
jgi:URI fold toxin 2